MGLFRGGNDAPSQPRKQGGNRAVLFVYVMNVLDNVAFTSNLASLVTYFFGYMNYSLLKSANSHTNWVGTCFLMALLGGFIADTYLSRFRTTVIFGCVELLGFALLALQARTKSLRPVPCGDVTRGNLNQCESPDSGQAALLFGALYLVAIGSGGVKAGLPPLGSDQFDENDPEDARRLSSFFNWYVFSLSFGSMIGVTLVVWVSTNRSWQAAFGICFLAIFLGLVILSMGRSFYRTNIPSGSPLTRILQVLVAAIRKWKLPVPESTEELHELHDREAGIGAEIIQRTNQFRFLDRAAITRNTHTTSSLNVSPWHVCTVTQVEETKIFIRMLPIILSTIFMNTCFAQLQTFSVQQTQTLDPNLFGFDVPGPSLPVIPLIFMAILVPIYDRLLVPLLRRLTGIPTGIRHLQRIGIGLVLSIISMGVAGIIETRRKSVAEDNNMVDSREHLPMSVFQLGYQYAIFGAADMFTLVGMLEFFNQESSKGMRSLSTSISWTSLAFGYYLSSVVVEVVNSASGGWLDSNNLNRNQLNYFYWLLSGLSVINFGFYLLCSSWYRYKKVGEMKHVNGNSNGGDIAMVIATVGI